MIVNEILNLNDSLVQLERDRAKIENRMEEFDITQKKLDMDGNNNYAQEKIIKDVKKEKENLKQHIQTIDRQTSNWILVKCLVEIRENILELESEIKNIEKQEKKNHEQVLRSDFKLRQLEKELFNSKEELKVAKKHIRDASGDYK